MVVHRDSATRGLSVNNVLDSHQLEITSILLYSPAITFVAPMDPVEIQKLIKRKPQLTLKEAADFIGMHPNFLYTRMGTERGPPAHKRGRVWRIPSWEFFQWAQRPETP